MLKYQNYDIVMAEVPNEVTLAINISNCPCHCVGCHTPELADDIGDELTDKVLDELVEENRSAITCVAFMGGDADPQEVFRLAKYIKKQYQLKTCWYSGRTALPEGVLFQTLADTLDYIKIGPYIEKYGPLNCKTTNQRMYGLRDSNLGIYDDITSKFYNK